MKTVATGTTGAIDNTKNFNKLTVFARVKQTENSSDPKLLKLASVDDHDVVRISYAANVNIKGKQLEEALASQDLALYIGASSNPNATPMQLRTVLTDSKHLIAMKNCASHPNADESVLSLCLDRKQNVTVIESALSNPNITEKMLQAFYDKKDTYSSDLLLKLVSNPNISLLLLKNILSATKDNSIKEAIASNSKCTEEMLLYFLDAKNNRGYDSAVLHNPSITEKCLLQIVDTNSRDFNTYTIITEHATEDILKRIFVRVPTKAKPVAKPVAKPGAKIPIFNTPVAKPVAKIVLDYKYSLHLRTYAASSDKATAEVLDIAMRDTSSEVKLAAINNKNMDI